MLYQICNGSVTLGGQTILSHVDFEVKGSEKIAIVGPNGAGKTSLLRLIAGEITPDVDDKAKGKTITSSRNLTVGMLRQTTGEERGKKVADLIGEGEAERYLYDKLFTSFGFCLEDEEKYLGEFSGGEQTKIMLIRLLLEKPDILLLDEPTNHLDVESMEWLEEYLRHYPKAVVMVSHDRFFLDRVANVVYDLEDGKLVRYAGNYSAYRKEKNHRLEVLRKKYDAQQAEIARLEELITRFKNKPSKANFARSRKTILERMERIEMPKGREAHIFTGVIEPLVPGNKWIAAGEHLKIGYHAALLEITFRIRRGQKIGIIGANGVGKSTFLKTLSGLIPPLDGEFSLGSSVLMGYFDQHTAEITEEVTVLEHFHRLFPQMQEKECRKILGMYLFPGQDTAKQVCNLSGGEKSRLVLAELLCSRPNFMILDEPTNHMDIPAKETLESAFSSYGGTMLFVSHDRYFLDQVADALFLFREDGVQYYPFGYSHYVTRRNAALGEDIAALIAAEDQALVAELHAVPRGERHRLRELGTEEAHLDWKLRLSREPMEEAAACYEHLYEQWLWAKQPDEELGRQLAMAEQRWSEACIAYYLIASEDPHLMEKA